MVGGMINIGRKVWHAVLEGHLLSGGDWCGSGWPVSAWRASGSGCTWPTIMCIWQHFQWRPPDGGRLFELHVALQSVNTVETSFRYDLKKKKRKGRMKGRNGCWAGLHRSFWRALHQLSRFILTTRWLKEKRGKRISYFSLCWNLFRYFVLLEQSSLRTSFWLYVCETYVWPDNYYRLSTKILILLTKWGHGWDMWPFCWGPYLQGTVWGLKSLKFEVWIGFKPGF